MSFKQIWDIFFLGFFVITNMMTSRKKHGQELEKKKKAANGWVLIGIKERIWQHNITYNKKEKDKASHRIGQTDL